MNSIAYRACKALITAGRTEDMQNKLDLYLANDRITAAEYAELTALLPKAEG